MLGWIADFFRFAWSLVYWNARKSWFRLRRPAAPCPCQAPSDSGRAYETRCDACHTWHKPERFRRVCPLLVRTPDGLRCSANTEEVRPFWRLAFLYFAATVVVLYVVAVVAVFSTLRTIGYPVSILHVGLPPMWHRVGDARGWFFLNRAEQAFVAGRTSEGMLYLANAYEFDPHNYTTGLELAQKTQLGHPARSDEIYRRLLAEHPTQRDATAQQWFRALLARGDFPQVAQLAGAQVLQGGRQANVWMRALIFATQNGAREEPLRTLLANPAPKARPWHQVIETELLVRANRKADAQSALLASWPIDAPPYASIYRIETLVRIGEPLTALDLLLKQRFALDGEAYLTLRLHCLASAGADQAVRKDFETHLLSQPISQPLLKIMCAQLVRHPDRPLFREVVRKVSQAEMPFNDGTAGGWFSLLCTAGAVEDTAQLHQLALRLGQAAQTPFAALPIVEAFYRGRVPDKRATSFLPFLPMPLEITYALIERYPGPPAGK